MGLLVLAVITNNYNSAKLREAGMWVRIEVIITYIYTCAMLCGEP